MLFRAIALAGLAGCTFRPVGATARDDARPADAPFDFDATGLDAVGLDAVGIDAPIAPNGYQQPITIQRSKVAGDLTGFPVWITLQGDSGLIQSAQNDHGDVYFTDVSGTPIPYEITAFSKPDGVLQAWVRAPHLTPSTQTPDPNVIYLRFGGAAAPTASSGAAVFDNGFAAVWHFDAAGTTVADATGTTPGAVVGTAPTAETGQLGDALVFASSTTQITFVNPITGAGSSTFSAWVNQKPITSGVYSNAIVVLGAPMANKSRWFYSSYGGDNNAVAAGLYSDDHLSSTTIQTSTWTKLDWVLDVGTSVVSTLYVNGQPLPSKTLSAKPATMPDGVIANAGGMYSGGNGTMSFNGALDELRLATDARSAPWLATEYANQSSPSTFYMVGTPQPL